nr:MAG TPA: hypothetical protein [Caudoviricetes sp.]
MYFHTSTDYILSILSIILNLGDTTSTTIIDL